MWGLASVTCQGSRCPSLLWRFWFHSHLSKELFPINCTIRHGSPATLIMAVQRVKAVVGAWDRPLYPWINTNNDLDSFQNRPILNQIHLIWVLTWFFSSPLPLVEISHVDWKGQKKLWHEKMTEGTHVALILAFVLPYSSPTHFC